MEQVQLYLDMPSGEVSVLRFIAEAEKWKTQMGEAYDSLVVTESTACKVLETQQFENSAVCPSAGPRSTHAYLTFGFTGNRESGVSSDVASTGVSGVRKPCGHRATFGEDVPRRVQVRSRLPATRARRYLPGRTHPTANFTLSVDPGVLASGQTRTQRLHFHAGLLHRRPVARWGAARRN